MLRKHTCPDELAKGWSRFVKEKGLHTGAREGVWRDALGREAATGRFVEATKMPISRRRQNRASGKITSV
jgi:hypothetical protein